MTGKKMPYNIDWVIPKISAPPSRLWTLASSFIIVSVGLFNKLVVSWLNKTKFHNTENLHRAIEERPQDRALITVANHHSCFDEPAIWAGLSLKHFFNRKSIRWSLTAHDICFTNALHSYFFTLGKCLPIVRGDGVYQSIMDFCVARLKQGHWVHIFPEGRVNMTQELLRFKWGIGRLIFELPTPPIVIPIWHVGMDQVLPNYPPYILKFGKKVTMNYGKPIDVSDLLAQLRAEGVSATEGRKRITDHIQGEMMKLKAETEALHAQHDISAGQTGQGNGQTGRGDGQTGRDT